MSNLSLRDDQQDQLREVCAAIDDALAHLPVPAETAPMAVDQRLRDEWAKLVALLALRPARRLRACPRCGRLGMFEATRCGNCWMKLPAATAADAVTRPRSVDSV